MAIELIRPPIVTDWVSYTPNLTATSSNPTRATSGIESAKWRRLGSVMEIRYSYSHTSTSGANAGTGDYLWSIPTDYTIDSAIIPFTTAVANARAHLGEFRCGNGTDLNSGQVMAYDSTRMILRVNSGSPASAIGSGFYPLNSTSDMQYSFTVSVPIAGWSANA